MLVENKGNKKVMLFIYLAHPCAKEHASISPSTIAGSLAQWSCVHLLFGWLPVQIQAKSHLCTCMWGSEQLHASCQEVGMFSTKGGNVYYICLCKKWIRQNPLWLWTPEQTSREIQNRGTSGPKKNMCPPKTLKTKSLNRGLSFNWSLGRREEARHFLSYHACH